MVGLQNSKPRNRQIEAAVIHASLQWLKEVIQTRIRKHFADKEADMRPLKQEGAFAENAMHFLEQIDPKRVAPWTFEEFVLFLLALTPHLHPGFIGNCISGVLTKAGDFPEIGGMRDNNNRGFSPTGETALFVMAGMNLEKRFKLLSLFNSEHWFYRKNILRLESPTNQQPKTNGRLLLDDDVLELVTTGKISRPALSIHFPAEYISTELEWDDLVLNRSTQRQIQELQTWVEHNDTLLQDWGMAKRLKPGYRALFYGPPGTGKTLTASLLGRYTGHDVFRIDLSMVVSKFIGETEKNLATLFDKAQNKQWILFFDEADALFGKRTNVRDAHDKYANQEVSYLLQRIEGFPGLVILASNFKNNIDDAFSRRFQSIIHFPFPKAAERIILWERAFPQAVSFEQSVDFQQIAKQYELTGSNIMNVVQYACLRALEQNSNIIQLNYILEGIRKEFSKDGKLV